MKRKYTALFLACMMLFSVSGLNGWTTVSHAFTTVEFAGGSGTAEYPWQIATAEQLNNVRNYLGTDNSDKHFILVDNIDLNVAPYNEDVGWEPIGNNWSNAFWGTFDGNGYTISNLFINRPTQDNVGLFGQTNNATVTGVTLLNVNVTGQNYVGGLVGYNYGGIYDEATGTINIAGYLINSSVSGNVSGYLRVGMLVGYNSYTGISGSFALGNVYSTDQQVGGLIGKTTRSTITNSYARANVTGFYGGGLIGGSEGNTVENSYAVGAVSGGNNGGLVGYSESDTITSCYHQGPDNGVGVLKTEDDMKQQATFVDWDFTNTWAINEGVSYPYLQWEPVEPNTDIIFVNASAAAGGDGTSWASAFNDLQNALAASNSGQEIWVAEGTYKPTAKTHTDDRSATFSLKEGVAIYGGFTGTESERSQRDWGSNVTTLSGDLNLYEDDIYDAFHVVTAGNGITSSAVLDGFTITGGNALGQYVNGDNRGGGINCLGDPTLNNLIIAANRAGQPVVTDSYAGGAGIFINGSPVLTNVTFLNNSIESSGVGGGGVWIYQGSVHMNDVAFIGNDAYTSLYGGGIVVSPYGLGIPVTPTTLVLDGVTFSANQAMYGGGLTLGADLADGSSAVLTNVQFLGNVAKSAGGGIYNQYDQLTIKNALFVGNTAVTEAGGGMYSTDAGTVDLTNATFVGNSCSGWAGAIAHYNNSDTLNIVNSIFMNNTADLYNSSPGDTNDIENWYSSVNISHSDYNPAFSSEVTAGSGNINADPLLTTDYRLQPGSPCIDTGDNSVVAVTTTWMATRVL